MMKFYNSLFLFLFLNISAQNQRFIYEYKFQNDSTNVTDAPKSEMMHLDISKKGSKFYSVDSYKADSIMADRNRKNPNHNNFEGIKFGKISWVVEKSYPEYRISFFDYVDTNEYQVSETRAMNWKILPEKEKIGEFNVQKATTSIFGRTWTAWFVPEIPIQDGPYKFHGLPGMIVKVADAKNTHVFELKAIKKLTDAEAWTSAADKKRFRPLVKIDEKQYKKVFIEGRENPTKGIRQMLASGMKVIMTDENGKQLDIEEHLRQQDRSQKEENKKNNNILELDLLK